MRGMVNLDKIKGWWMSDDSDATTAAAMGKGHGSPCKEIHSSAALLKKCAGRRPSPSFWGHDDLSRAAKI